VPASPAVPAVSSVPAADPQNASAPQPPRRRIPAQATRATVVAATALAVLLPAAPAPADQPVATAPVVTTPAATVTAAVELAAATAPAPAPATVAMQLALSKIGAPYRYGAAGPNAFDCSGLVNWAFRGAGITLPRTSRALSQVGTPIARADLQPGDLVFFYRPISHVAIYIGDGKVVHASNRRSPVKISDLAGMKFTSARRI
jgi:peptidoglycan DL-endopeptidase CwlO